MNAREILDSAWPAEGGRLARATDAVRTRVTEALPLLGTVFGLWLLTRFGYALVTYLTGVLQLSPLAPPLQPPGFTDVILRWQRWDVNHYLIVSRVGYSEPGEANFFPLYPLSVGAVSWLLGDGSAPSFPTPDKVRLVVGMALSNLGLLVGLYAIARLASSTEAGMETAPPPGQSASRSPTRSRLRSRWRTRKGSSWPSPRWHCSAPAAATGPARRWPRLSAASPGPSL